jgi:cbb3-type cytochrome oxidase maturation protein
MRCGWDGGAHEQPRMNSLFVLLPVSLVLLGIAVATLVWATRHGQFEDLDAASIDALVDDPAPDTRDAD